MMAADAFTQAVMAMRSQGPDVYKTQTTPLCTCLREGNLYVGRAFGKAEEVSKSLRWTAVVNLQAPKSGKVWYAEQLPEGCTLKTYSLPRSTEAEGASDAEIKDIVKAAVTLASAPGACVFIHDAEEGVGYAAVVGTLVWHTLDEQGGRLLDMDRALVPEEDSCKRQLKRLLKNIQETLEVAWKRGDANK